MKIIFNKDFTDKNGQFFKKGLTISVAEESAKYLIDNGYAEEFKAQQNDQIVAIQEGKGLDEDKVKEIVQEVMDNSAKEAELRNLAKFDSEKDKQKAIYPDMGQFAKDVAGYANGQMPETLKSWMEHCKASGMNSVIDDEGGFLVPTEFRNQLMAKTLDQANIASKAMSIPVNGNSIDIPVIKETSRTSSVFGGVIVYRPAEGDTITSSKPQFGLVNLKLKKLAAMVYSSSEMLEDSPMSVARLIDTLVPQALGFQIDDDILNGSGVNMSLGLYNAPALVSVSKESAQLADTIVLDNVIKMRSRMHSYARSSAEWFAHPDTEPFLMKLAYDIGSGGELARLYNLEAGTLAGRPITFTEHCKALGDKGDIYFANMQAYLLAQKATGMRADVSMHVKFSTDEQAFRFIMRYDGQPWEQSSLTLKRGSKARSSFITLAERS